MLASSSDCTVLTLCFTLLKDIWDLLFVCFSRSVWNIHSTWCLTVTSRMRSVSCLPLRVGGTGRSQQLRIRRPNWSTPTRVYWIISSGVTKSSHTPTTLVRWYTAQHPKHLLFTCVSYADMMQALVWCHTDTYRSQPGTTLVKKKNELKRWSDCRKHICVYNFYTKCPLVCLVFEKIRCVNSSYCFRVCRLCWQPRNAQLLQTGVCESKGDFEKSWRLGSLLTELHWGKNWYRQILIFLGGHFF